MIITGVVIDVEPAACSTALAVLQGQPGITRVEGAESPGRLVAVAEAENESGMEALMGAILATPGIVSVNPAFIHFDV